MARPRLPGWPLESRSNAGSREMITGPGNGTSQNPAYRPSPAFFFQYGIVTSNCVPLYRAAPQTGQVMGPREEGRVTGNSPQLEPREARALEEFVHKVRERLGENLVALKLFGSKATGRGAPDSDIDVLVVVNGAGAAVEDQVLDVAFDVNVVHEVYISPRVVARATLEDPVWRLTPFLQAVEKDGVPL
jgi:predicted nucleotidyltransferase